MLGLTDSGDGHKSSAVPAAPGQGPPSSMGFFLPPYASPYPNGSSVPPGRHPSCQPPSSFCMPEWAGSLVWKGCSRGIMPRNVSSLLAAWPRDWSFSRAHPQGRVTSAGELCWGFGTPPSVPCLPLFFNVFSQTVC
ncbi:hypothetical protein RRG08_027690 [Elysia crispata]|uniref:Uncharacterized protein n=1 Tax=Elysia crispata TaxID=231223 RepID=A0AAE0XM70_9GAST|nr:hypothetical protein RRG08_027690 [Elysia crispata]